MKLTLTQRTSLARQGVAALLIGKTNLAAKGFSAAATGQWEGWQFNRYRNRPATRLESQDSTLDYGTREAMMSEARSLSQTFSIVRRIMRAYANYCVGSCLMKWNTGDVEVDRLYRKYWRDSMPMLDANGIHHFRKQTRIVTASTVRDGDILGQKILDSGFGQVRLIEADRVNTAGCIGGADEELRGPDGRIIKRVVGGITVNGQGRRVSARVWDRLRNGQFSNRREIPWSEIFHVFDSDRADAVRGVTHFHTALDPARDYKETKQAERLASKRNSKLALLVKTVFGGAGAGAGVNLFENDTPTQSGENKVNVQEVSDVADAFMFPNEDIKAHTSERPSDGWRWLMEDLVREISVGLDLPFGVVWNMAGLGGPAARFEINQAARTFTAFIEDVLEPKWLIPVAGWKLAEAIESGEVPFHRNWTSFKPQRPVYITIDLGRDSKAGIEENKAALLTATSWFEEMGLDYEEETELLFQEEKFRQDMAAKYGVPIGNVRVLNPNPVPTEPTPANPVEEKSPMKKAA